MKPIFWGSAAFVIYTYAGYPLWVYFRSRWKRLPVRSGDVHLSVSIVMAVRNEENILARKLRNLNDLDYPKDLYEVIVVSDGSSDGTNAILDANCSERLRVFALPEQGGKASALNRGIREARGEIVVFTDARQLADRDAVTRLVQKFADQTVGAVTGELILRNKSGKGLGLYWEFEKKVREWESVCGSVVGATGALYAVRRDLLVPLPTWTILDDVYLPLNVVRQGKRVVFEPGARAYDDLGDSQHEFRRKVRTLTGNYQLLELAPWLLSRANPLRFEFVCHKLFRLVVPLALVGLIFSTFFLPHPFYRLALILQIAFYSLGALAGFKKELAFIGRAADVSLAFLLLNTAAALAFFYFVTGKKTVWIR